MLAEGIKPMDSTEITGKVVNGVIILENGETLPDGTMVRVEPLEADKPAQSADDVAELREMLLSHAGAISDSELPSDLAENLDHYLYGTPKRT